MPRRLTDDTIEIAPSAANVAVRLSGVSFWYSRGSSAVLDGVDLELYPHQMVAISGPSGSGKSTLLQLIGGVLRPQKGHIEGIGPGAEQRWIYQYPAALLRRSVLDNVLLGAWSRCWDVRQARDAALSQLEAVGLVAVAARAAGALSGGELQRVQVARALVAEPALVLADEPTGQLDRRATSDVLAAFRRALRGSTALVIATHDPVVVSACDRRLSVADGRLLAA